MTPKTIYLALLFCCSLFVRAQPSWNWAKDHSTLLSNEASFGIAIDSVNKVIYSCGFISNASAFSTLAASDMNAGTNNGNLDGYLAKHDFNGNLLWCVSIGSVNDDKAYAVNYSVDGNVYITGYCQGNTVFKSLTSSNYTLAGASGNTDVFVASYTSNGKLRWAKRGGGTQDDSGQSITTSGNAVYVMGYFNTSASFGAYSTAPANTKMHYFICSYDFVGNESWVATAQSNGDDGIANNFSYSHSKIAYSNDTLFVIGEDGGNNMSFVNSNTTNFSTVLGNSGGNNSIFYGAVSAGGNWVWVQQIQAGNSPQFGFGIAADCGGVYICGSIHPNATFPSSYVLNSPDHDVPFMARCNRSNGTDVWVKSWPSSTNHEDIASQIYADGNGYIYVSGSFKSNNFFAPDDNFGVAVGVDMFIAKYRTDGMYKWSQAIKGVGDNMINDFKISGGKLFVSGYYETNISFPGILTLTSGANANIFLASATLPADLLFYSCCSAAPGPALAAANQSICGVSSTLIASSPAIGSGHWYVVEGANSTGSGTIAAPLSFTSPVTGLTTVTNIFTWVVSDKFCNPSIDSLIVSRDFMPTPALAGSNQTVCAVNTLTLNGNIPVIGTGAWSVITGTANILAPSSSTTAVNSFGAGTNVLQWTITNGTCPPSTSTLMIKADAPPTTAAAGSSQIICANTNSLVLNGNVPSTGSGSWSLLSGTATIISPASPAATVTSLATGTNVLQWTISNGVCSPSSSSLSVQVDAMPSPAIAGSSQTICSSTSSVTLNATSPSVGSGLWSVLSGSASFGSASSASSSAYALSTGTNVLQWTTFNGVCPVSVATVGIRVDALPTAANAGSNQTICANNPSATLTANTPVQGNGAWSVISGSASISALNSATTSANGISTGTNILMWSITSGVCPASTATVSINVNAMPTPALAGSNQTLCANSPSATLAANAPSAGTGQWSLISGTGTIVSPSLPNSAFNSAGTGTNVLQWTTTNGVCPPSSSTVSVQVDQTPTPASAGVNQTICANNPSSTLSANSPSVGSGLWQVVAGSGTFASASSATTVVSSLATGTNVLRWTTSNGVCPSSSSTISIQVDALPSPAVAGSSQTLCINSPSFALGANAPTTGTGTWSVLAGSASLSSSASAATNGTVFASGYNVLQWTISNGVCPSSSSTLSIQVDQMPTAATAGANQTLCANNASLLLNANTPATGSGLWSVTSGSATVSAPSSPSTNAFSFATGTNVLQWTITNGVCPASASSLTVQVDQMPAASIAGTSQTICASSPSLSLSANSPSIGTGVWSVLTGTASFASPNSPASAVSLLSTGNNVLQWTISNGSCPPSQSTLNIQVDDLPTAALAGSNQTICINSATVVLNANVPSVGTGSWSVLNGTATILSQTSPTSAVLFTSGNHTLGWTIANGVCPASSSTVGIQVDDLPTVAFAGSNQTVCANNPSVMLNANNPVVGTGFWSLVSGSAVIGSPSLAASTISSIANGINVLQWSVSNGVCPVSSSTVSVQVDALPSMALAGPDQTLCAAASTLNANAPQTGTGIWQVISGTGTVTANSNPASPVNGLGIGLSAFEWIISNGVCPPARDTIQIFVNSIPPAATTIAGYSICENDTLFIGANTTTVGTGAWSVLQGNGVVSNSLSPSAFVSSFSYGENIFRWTISNYPCPVSYSDLHVMVYQKPGQAIAGDRQLVYSETAVLHAQLTQPGSGQWYTPGQASIADPGNKDTPVSNLVVGDNIFIWQLSNGVCPVNSDTLLIHRENIVIPNAFSPNGDQVNDNFFIKGIESLGEVKLFVYNRWGSIVHESSSYSNGWNGTSPDGKELSDDTYYYVIKTGNGTEIKGYVLIKRD